MAAALALSLAAALGACATQGDEGGPDPALRGQWQLGGGWDAAGGLDLSGQRISLTIGRAATTSGRSSCSDYTAQFFGTLGSLWVTTHFPAKPQCGTQFQQNLEARYAGDLSAVRSAIVEGGQLQLNAPGVGLFYQRALPLPMDGVVGYSWQLVGVSSVPVGAGPSTNYVDVSGGMDDDHPVTLRFEKDGTLDGKTGCHLLLQGHYEQNAGELVVRHLRTLYFPNGCNSSEFILDDYLQRVLRSGFSFLATRGSLTLTSTRAGINLHFLAGG